MVKRNILKIGAVALCTTIAASVFAACGKNSTEEEKYATIGIDQVDIIAYGDTISGPLGATGDNRVSEVGNTIRVDVAEDTYEVEFDVTKFFDDNAGYLGKDFYFTRDDVKKPDHTLVKGHAWVETEGGNPDVRKYKMLGYENDEETEAMTKGEIKELDGREGEARLYVLTQGIPDYRYLLYLDPDTTSNIAEGETKVTYKLHGDNGEHAQMKVLVNK
jgi:hypothetical protein